MDAEVMVRRSERALGQAIRAGQERGEIGDRSTGGKVRQQVATANSLPSPESFYSHSHERMDSYAMTDGVTDEEFEHPRCPET